MFINQCFFGGVSLLRSLCFLFGVLAKLDVLGNIKITDGTQGTGKVLTSNADGSAHWALPAVTYQNYIGGFPDFKGYYPSTEFSTEETEYSRTSFSVFCGLMY